MQVEIPTEVVEILTKLEDAGHDTWCVGGAVRDAILEAPGADVDLATAATPDQVMALFPRTVPVGIEHGTVGVLDGNNDLHEVTTFRRDVATDGRHARVEFGASIEEDLARRDFTINAIAYHPLKQEWRDPFDGIGDMNLGVIRAVGDPIARFREDRLRILRAFRFATRFGFAIDDDTWNGACLEVPGTIQLSAERVREEWWKSVQRDVNGNDIIDLWERSGVASVWLQTGVDAVAKEIRLTKQNGHDPLLLLAIWRRPIEGVLRHLKASSADISRARLIDRYRDLPLANDPVEVRRWLAKVGPAAADLMAIHSSSREASGWLQSAHESILRREPTSRGDLVVTGDDLIAERIATPGPELGRLLDRLLEAVLINPDDNQRARLLDIARRGIN